MKKILLYLMIVGLASSASFAQGSDQKDDILGARRDAKEAKKNRAHCAKLGFPASAGDNRCFSVYPSDVSTWGKGFSEGMAKVTLKGKSGFINTDGKLVIPAKFKDVGLFSEGLAPFESSKSRWGFIDMNGKITIPAKFDWAISFSEGLALVQLGNLWGYIDRTGKFVIPAKFEEAESFSEGLAEVTWYDKSLTTKTNPEGKQQNNFINIQGKIMFSGAFDSISRSFDEGIALVNRSIKCPYGSCSETYLINKNGERLWTLDSWYVSWFGDDAITVAKGKDTNGHDLYSVLGRDGKQLFDKTFSQIGQFSHGYAPARLTWVGKFGFIDKHGEYVIEPKFDWAKSFSDGLAAVEIDSSYGYIDRSGNLVIAPQFEFADHFQDGFALVSPSGKRRDTTGYIDRTGNYIWKPTK